MTGEKLHLHDVRLCRHVLDNVLCYTDRPGFAAYAEEELSPAVWKYLQALDTEDEPAPLLLRDQDFDDLVEVFEGGFDRPWVAYEPLYRKSIDCVREIRDALAGAYAEEWACVSAQASRKLEDERTRLSDGIQTVHDWVSEARRLLRAMGATAYLPRPEGAFPTPGCAEPAPRPNPSQDFSDKEAIPEDITGHRGGSLPSLANILERLAVALEKHSGTAPQAPMAEALSKEDAAKFIGVDLAAIEYLIRAKKLEYVQYGAQRGRVIPVASLRKFLDDHRQLTSEELRRKRKPR